MVIINSNLISMELSKEESEEKPRNLWKEVDLNKYQVKAINLPLTIIILLNFYNLNNNDFLIIYLKVVCYNFFY